MKKNKRFIVLKLVLTLVAVPALLFSSAGCVSDEYYEKEFDRLVIESPRWKDIFDVCNRIPKPADFKIVRRRMGNAHLLIILGYKSSMTKENGFGFFDQKLQDDGWEFVGDGFGLNSSWREYRKSGLEVSISHGTFANGANFSVSCQAPD